MNQKPSQLHKQHCKDIGAAQLLSDNQRNFYLNEFSDWDFSPVEQKISRHFKFKNYDDTCTILYNTHSADGVTLYDFICAAHIEQL